MSQMDVQLPVALIKEDDQIVAYTPALDISTCGKTEAEARARFDELVRMFFADLIETNSIDTVLTELGLERHETRWSPPAVSQESISVRVPAFA